MDVPFISSLLFVVILFSQGTRVQTYPGGVPVSACLSRYPQHGGVQARLDPSPFKVTIDRTYYLPGDVIIVTVNSHRSDHQFKGIILVAHRLFDGVEELQGTFQDLSPDGKLVYLSCEGRTQSAVTHKNSKLVSSIQVGWKAPATNVGIIVFEATIVESYKIFTTNLRSQLLRPAYHSPPMSPPVIKTSSVKQKIKEIDLGRCGESKGCLLYPRYCTDHCLVAVSFQFVDSGKVHFEMFTRIGSYVSVGFSQDKTMGNEQTITCTGHFDHVGVQHGYNHPGQYNVRERATNLTDLEVTAEDGGVSCRFTRLVAMGNKVMLVGEHLKTIQTDLNNKYYLFIAWGDTFLSTDTPMRHRDWPVVSDTKVFLRDTDIFRGSSMPALIKSHASLMCLAWMGFAPLAILTARYYKEGFRHKTVWKAKVWLHIHRTAAILTGMLTVSGLTTVIIHLDGEITQKESSFNHMCLGFCVGTLVCIQSLMTARVPGQSSNFRPVFNLIHRCFGTASLIIAAATILTAYDIQGMSSEMKTFGRTTLAVWAGTLVLLAVCMEAYAYLKTKYAARKIRNEAYDLDKINTTSYFTHKVQKERAKQSGALFIILIIFFICSLVAGLCMILFF